MNPRSISLADVLIALRALAPTDPAERRAIMRLLGFDLEPPVKEDEQQAQQQPGARTGGEARTPETPAVVTTPTTSSATPHEGESQTEVVRLPDVRSESLALPTALARPVARPRTRAAPLLLASWEPVIASRLGARPSPTGAVDVPRLLDLLARRAPLRQLPRRQRLTTVPDVTVVLDTSGVMAWLHEDQVRLVEILRATLRTNVVVVACDGPPEVTAGAVGHAGAAEDAEDADDTEDEDLDTARVRIRVSDGSRVIAVTDLGIGSSWEPVSPARVAAWRHFERSLTAAAASLIVLSPLPRARIVRHLPALRVLHWDRTMTPSQVQALVKDRRWTTRR